MTSWKVLPSARTCVRWVVSAWVTAMFVHAAFPPFCAAASVRHFGSPVAWYISHRLPGKKPLVHHAA
jgi:hypothetical protein